MEQKTNGMKTKVKFYMATYEPIEEGEIATEEVVAVFVDNKFESLFECYANLGQHSYCSSSFIAENCRNATENEYKDLYNELTKLVGYNLEVL